MKRYRILIFEDSRVYAENYRRVFDKEDFEIKLISTGIDVVETVLDFDPDIILMDIYLPGADGLMLCRELKDCEDTKDYPIVIVTTEGDVKTLKKAYKIGINEYIKKPFNSIELLIRIENVLKLRKRTMEVYRLAQDKTVTEMGRAIAHNFNQPLTTILGATEILQYMQVSKECGDDVNDLLDIIVSSSKRLSKLVNRVEGINEYKSTDYIQDIKIIDLEGDE